MNRKISLLSLFLAAIVATTVSCSSGDKDGDAASSDVAEATSDSTDAAANPDAIASDTPPADGAAATDQAAVDGTTPPADSMAADPSAIDPNVAVATPDNNPPADPNAPPADPNAAVTTPPADATAQASPAPDAAASPAPETASNDLFGGAAATTADSATNSAPPADEKPKKAMLAHIKSKPFKKGGQLLNTVYLAREGDTIDSVSDKLFGENKVKQMKKANPALKANLNAGDKVYFNSPNRADDAEKMMTVYEDQGLPATTYTSKDGDTLKSLAMEWYGSEGSFKEIYAINKNLSSTTELPAGTDLQYWPASVNIVAYAKKDAGTQVADNGAPPAIPEPAPAAANTAPMTPPPVPNMAQNQMPPSPNNGMPGAGTMNNGMNPPPPPPDLNAPAFPPPPSAMKKKAMPAEAVDKDTIMYAVAAGILLIGGGTLVAIRRRSAKRNQGITQV